MKGGESDVIIEFTNDTDAVSIIRGSGAGSKAWHHQGHSAPHPQRPAQAVGRAPEGQESQPRPSRRGLQRPHRGHGRCPRRQTDGLHRRRHRRRRHRLGHHALARRPDRRAIASGQRVKHFKDFVNGRTTAYDDWATARTSPASSPATATTRTATREGIAPGANIIALKALDGDGTGTISNIIAAIDYAVA